LGDEAQVVLRPCVRLLGTQLLQLGPGFVEPAQLEQSDALLAPRLAVLAVQLDRLAGGGERVTRAAQVVERHRLEQVQVLEQRPFSKSREACSSRSGTAGSLPSGDGRQGGAGGSGCGRWAPRTASEASIGLAVDAAGAVTSEALAGGLAAGTASTAGRARLQE